MQWISTPLFLLCILTVMCYTGLTYRGYSSLQLKSFNRPGLTTSQQVTTALHEAGILKKPARRGTTAGKKHYSSIQVVRPSWPITHERYDYDTSPGQTGVNFSNLISIKTKQAKSGGQPVAHFCLINACSVKNKATTIHQYIIDNDLDILAVTETWLRPGDVDSHILSALLPSGYTIKHATRDTGYGGVAIIHKSSIVLNVLDVVKATNFESVCVSIATDNRSDTLCAIYRPPPNLENRFTSKKFLEEFSELVVQCAVRSSVYRWRFQLQSQYPKRQRCQ